MKQLIKIIFGDGEFEITHFGEKSLCEQIQQMMGGHNIIRKFNHNFISFGKEEVSGVQYTYTGPGDEIEYVQGIFKMYGYDVEIISRYF